MKRSLTKKDLAYEEISEVWEEHIDQYDLERRLEVLVDDFLDGKIKNKTCLDAGCGLGYFSFRLKNFLPLSITSVDISSVLINKLKIREPFINAVVGDILNLESVFPDKKFDIVVSSEMIEHTPNPRLAIDQLCSVLNPNGYICLSCPNYFWKWTLHLANFLKIRDHYKGYENWVGPFELVNALKSNNLTIVRKVGIHLFPWHFIPRKLMKLIDLMCVTFSYYFSVNLAILAQKKN